MPTQIYKNKTGKRIPSVTSVLSNIGWKTPGLIHWAWNEGVEGRDYRGTKQEAADAGTMAHYLIECDIKKQAPDIKTKYPNASPEAEEKAKNCYMNFLDWKQGNKIKLFRSEYSFISEKYQYGGTLDCIAKRGRELVLLDWKTSNGVYPDMKVQLAAYGEGWNENNPDNPITGGFHLLQIEKESASFHHHFWGELKDAWEAFLAALKLHELHKRIK